MTIHQQPTIRVSARQPIAQYARVGHALDAYRTTGASPPRQDSTAVAMGEAGPR
jgi:hypothetical protein